MAHGSVAAASAASIFKNGCLFSRSATISEACSRREVPFPPRSLSPFDDDVWVGSTQHHERHRNWLERDADGKPRAVSSSSFNSAPASRHWRMPRLPNRQWLRLAACAVRAPGAGGCAPCGCFAGSPARRGIRRPCVHSFRMHGARDRRARPVRPFGADPGGGLPARWGDNRNWRAMCAMGWPCQTGRPKAKAWEKGMAQDSLTGKSGVSRSQVETLAAERCSGIKVLERPLCVPFYARRSRERDGRSLESKGAGVRPPSVRIGGGVFAAVAGKAFAASRPDGE